MDKAQHDVVLEHESDLKCEPELPNRGLVPRAFWLTIFALIGVSLVLAAVGFLRSPEPAGSVTYEISATVLERVLSKAANKARDVVTVDISPALDKAYEPAYAAITEYADFHYSLRGQYIELTALAAGSFAEKLNDRLLDGLEQRIDKVMQLADQQYADAYRDILQTEIASLMPPESSSQALGDATQALLQDAQTRVVASPLVSAASAAAVGGSLKAASSAAGKKVAAQVAAKTFAKNATKAGATAAGVGTSTLICAWAGPYAVLCGVAGGVAAWIAFDGAIVNIDEYINREDFEDALRTMLDEDKAARQRFIEQMLAQKAAAMDEAAEEMMKDFTLRELSGT